MAEIYEVNGRLFRYRNGIVECVVRADEEMIADEADWKERHGSSLYGIDDDGYMVIDSAGLALENWENVEARNEYLEEFANEISAEVSYLTEDFIKEFVG